MRCLQFYPEDWSSSIVFKHSVALLFSVLIDGNVKNATIYFSLLFFIHNMFLP
jgi:hypothetical protein